MEVIANIFELRAAVTNAFGEKSFIETLERRGMYRSRIASVVDTDWSTEDGQLIAHHWTVDPEPIVEKFNFPPSWSNKESWKNTFESDYPECLEDALDIALWTPRTPSRLIIEDDNGIRVLKSIETDPVQRVEERKIKPVSFPIKRKKFVDNSPTLFGA
jgi:hypothetical protein